MTSQELFDKFKWRLFVVGDLFDIEKGQRLTKNDILVGNIPFITATTYNNGVNNRISNDLKTWKNAITVCYDGEPGISFYHPYLFSASDSICILILKGKTLNPNIGLFLCTCLEKLKLKYGYGKKLNKERLTKETIWLPVIEENINYEGMEKYMEEIHKEIIPEVKEFDLEKEELSLKTDEWEEFIVGDLFDFITNSQIEARLFIPGIMPIIQASSVNNGVTDYIGNLGLNTASNYITISLTGDPGIAFYHDYECIPSSRVTGLKLKPSVGIMNKEIGVFMATCLEKLRPKYSYGKSLSKNRLIKEKIWLPTDEYGNPDYEFMEKYIKSLAFSEIIT